MNTHGAVLAAREIGGAGEREPRSRLGVRVPADAVVGAVANKPFGLF
jgi:hypothetical protein